MAATAPVADLDNPMALRIDKMEDDINDEDAGRQSMQRSLFTPLINSGKRSSSLTAFSSLLSSSSRHQRRTSASPSLTPATSLSKLSAALSTTRPRIAFFRTFAVLASAVLLIVMVYNSMINFANDDYNDDSLIPSSSTDPFETPAIPPPPPSDRLEYNSRFFTANGFTYCPGLNGAQFDALAYVLEWNQTVAAKNPTVEEFVAFVDGKAKDTYHRMSTLHDSFVESDMKSFACYMAADGANELVDISDSRLLHTYNAQTYMFQNIPHVVPMDSPIPEPRRSQYKMAYLILAEGSAEVLENIKHQLSMLDSDGESIVLIHVDSRSKDLHEAIEKHIREGNMVQYPKSLPTPHNDVKAENTTRNHDIHTEKSRRDDSKFSENVFLTTSRYPSILSHASQIWMLLNGYFALLDLAGEWTHVVNLTPYDVPVRNGKEIVKIMGKDEIKDTVFLRHWDVHLEVSARMLRQHVLYRGANHFHIDEAGVTFPPFYASRACEHSPFTVLPRSFITHLRTDDRSATVLAFFEHIWKPSNLYLCNVILSNPVFASRVVNHARRLVKVDSENHPRNVTLPRDEDLPSNWSLDFDGGIIDYENELEVALRPGGTVQRNVKREYLFAAQVNVRADEGKRFIRVLEGMERKDGFMKWLEQRP
ncbi:hypothetical protein BC829DRAFT_437381 [Chytridium lagenaria]|nr:hypothetical protein BC829DRAFT_437381 [Chytridium lagenaria]